MHLQSMQHNSVTVKIVQQQHRRRPPDLYLYINCIHVSCSIILHNKQSVAARPRRSMFELSEIEIE
jgi:hypothetical protein